MREPLVTPSDALLRTLAAVPPGARVLDLVCRDGRTTEALVRLGFDVRAFDPDPAHVEAARQRLAAALGDETATRIQTAPVVALGLPDAHVDWAVVDHPPEPLPDVLAEVRRVLRPGAWAWVRAPQGTDLDAAAEAAGLVVAQEPAPDGPEAVHLVVRRVEADTVG